MGDRTWTGITFSGKVNKEIAEGLVECLIAQGCQDQDGGRDLTLDDLRKPHEQFSDDECNYATMEGVESHCEEHGIIELVAGVRRRVRRRLQAL